MTKVCNAWTKKAERSYLSWSWRVTQTLKKKWIAVSKMTWGIWHVMTRVPKVSKLELNGILLSKVENEWAENLLWSYVSWQWRMIRNLISSKFTWGIWQNVAQVLKNLKNLHFKGLLLTKVCNVWAKKVQKSYVWWHWILMQNLKVCAFKNITRNLGNFHQSTWKFKNWDFHGILLSKVENVWA